MAKESPIQTSFNGGIFSPLLDGHIDAPRRGTSYADSNNLLALKQGPLVRRGGTTNIVETINPGGNTKVKMIPFLFNDEESYIMRWSGEVIRFFTDDGIVLDSTTTQTITAVTNATPPVVTVAATASWTASNQYVITGLTEATSLNNLWYKPKNFTGTTAELFDFDDATAWIAPKDSNGDAVAETSSTGSMSEIYALVTPWDENDLFDSDCIFQLDVVQSNDVMYVAGPATFAPRVITRTADDAWTINALTFNNGPYQQQNSSDDTMDIATTGSPRVFTITTSAANIVLTSDTRDAASGGDANDLGTATESDRLLRINDSNFEDEPVFKWGRITKYLTTTTFEITVDDEAENISGSINPPTVKWALGAYSDTTGYPTVTTMHEGRLCFGATSSEPRRVDLSASSGFNATETDFTPTSTGKGLLSSNNYVGPEVRPDDSISVTIGGGSANPIQWIESITQGLAVGTLAAEGIIQSSTNSEVLTGENASYKKSSTTGSAGIQPIPIKNALIHVQFARRRLQELIYNFENDGFNSFDMTELAEHLTRGKIIAAAYQQQPIETIWCVLQDGDLIAFTYERNSDVLGWHRHTIGGTDTLVKDVAVKPSSSLNRDELWLSVQRTVAGKAATTRTYVETMQRFYEDDIAREDIFQQDSGLIYSTSDIAVTSMTAASPIVVTSAIHGRSVDEFVYFSGVTGMNDSDGNAMINGQVFKVETVPSTTTMTLSFVATGTVVDGSGYSAAGTGGTLQQAISVFQGLDYLEGEEVEIYLDGNTTPNQTVAGGAITLPADVYGANVSIGLPSDWLFKSHKIEAGSVNGTAQGKPKRFNQVIVRLASTLGFKYGDTEDTATYEHEFTNATVIDNQTPLFTGDAKLTWPGGFETDGQIVFKGEGPFPAQIQSIMPQIITSDNVR